MHLTLFPRLCLSSVLHLESLYGSYVIVVFDTSYDFKDEGNIIQTNWARMVNYINMVDIRSRASSSIHHSGPKTKCRADYN